MDLITIILIAFGLAMDALAASLTMGMTIRNLKMKHALEIACFFGAFQTFMPAVGWLAGFTLASLISGVDHWVAFGLLSFIGCKMIYESTKMKQNEKTSNALTIWVLLFLSVATSIDALAVGLSFALLKTPIATPIIVIGVVTFSLSLLGVSIGKRFGHLFENKIEIVGGFILITIGIKVLVEHLI